MPVNREEDFKELIHFHYMTYMANPTTRTSAPVVMRFGRHFLGYHYYRLSLSALT